MLNFRRFFQEIEVIQRHDFLFTHWWVKGDNWMGYHWTSVVIRRKSFHEPLLGSHPLGESKGEWLLKNGAVIGCNWETETFSLGRGGMKSCCLKSNKTGTFWRKILRNSHAFCDLSPQNCRKQVGAPEFFQNILWYPVGFLEKSIYRIYL